MRPPLDPAQLRRLATGAIDAAMHAGADWADIRIGDHRVFRPSAYGSSVTLQCGFGLRVRVNGAEAFVGGADPVPDLLAAAAKSAVATARELSAASGDKTTVRSGLAPAPSVTGEWRAPIAIDPFAMSIDDHAAMVEAADGAHDGRLNRLMSRGFRPNGGQHWTWIGEMRVLASSEGTLLTQTLANVDSRFSVEHWNWRYINTAGAIRLPVHGQGARTAGFEAALDPHLYDDLEAALDEIATYAQLPVGEMDVGRYAVVFDGHTQAAFINELFIPALSLNRVLGNEVDLTGTSFLAPPKVFIGDAVASPLMSLQVDGPGPQFGARRWDDDGVETRTVPLIQHGTLVDYLTSRSSLGMAHAMGKAGLVPATIADRVMLGGTTRAEVASRPAERAPSLSMAPSATPMSLAALARQMGKGLLVRGGWVSVDPEGIGGFIYPGMLFEVKGGQVVRRIIGARLMFSTKRMLQPRALIALGDADTQLTWSMEQFVPGVPWILSIQAVTAPAAAYPEVDLVSSTM